MPRQEPAEWSSGGKIANFQRIEWKIIPDAATASAALQNGEVDWYEQSQADLVPMLRRNSDIVIGPSNPQGYIGGLRFNCLHPPFDDVRLRRAVLHADDHGERPISMAHLPVAVPLWLTIHQKRFFVRKLEGRSSSRRLRSGSRSARKGSTDRNASGAGGLPAVAQLVFRSALTPEHAEERVSRSKGLSGNKCAI